MCVQRKTFESSNETDRISLIQASLIDWGKKNYSNFPWRHTQNQFHALIAEVMLQRTKAEQVVAIFNNFVSHYPRVEYVSLTDSHKIQSLLKPLGLFWRNKKIVELVNELAILGKIPEKYEELIKLPGVGHYAASAYLCFHLSVRATIIDSNAVRLWSRIFKLEEKGEIRRRKGFTTLVNRITPEKEYKIFNYAVLDFTRNVCKLKPLCNKCPLNECCNYYQNRII